MASDSEFVAHVRDLLAPIDSGAEPVSIRRMFGGHGVFVGGTMFALIADQTLYFKVDAQSVDEFVAAGCEAFAYRRGDRTIRLSYYSAPDGATEVADDLQPWAERAIAAARRGRPR